MSKLLKFLSAWCLLAAWAIPTRAQFPSFPASNSIWLEEVHDGPNLLYTYILHMRAAGHDTLVNGSWFNTLWGGLEGSGSVFLGGIRSDADHRVYYYHPNTDSTYLLYDFDPAVGDSMEVWVGDPYSPSANTLMMHVDTIAIEFNNNGTMYKRIGIMSDAAILGGQGVVDWWTQGRGGTGGLLTTIGSLSVSVFTVMSCMQANDTLWPGGSPGLCWPTSISEHGFSTPVVHPNPSTGQFTLTSSAAIEQVLVFDPQGREVLRTQDASFDLSAHSPGLYTAVVTTEQGRRAVRLVVQCE
jgi:hypothetical protein